MTFARYFSASLVAALLPLTGWSAALSAPSESVIYSFRAGTNGAGPIAGLMAGANGALYGTTIYGGGSPACDYGCGTVFRLNPRGTGFTETVLYVFQGGSDGARPFGGVVSGADGSLYGTTRSGGGLAKSCELSGIAGCGTVFRLRPHGHRYTESVVHQFTNTPDGATPLSTLIVDARGVLYGTTSEGGAFGEGTVFALFPSGTSYAMAILHNFAGAPDGARPSAGLTADASGTFYGTTQSGGDANCPALGGCGTAFSLVPNGAGYVATVLYAFRGGDFDGEIPIAGLIEDPSGVLYGTTESGDGALLQSCFGGCGTVFSLTRSGSGSRYLETILHGFTFSPDGGLPQGGLLRARNGVLYGTTNYGGEFRSNGTVYELQPSGSGYQESVVHDFRDVPDGAVPYAGLIHCNRAALCGTTFDGGTMSKGSVFEFKP